MGERAEADVDQPRLAVGDHPQAKMVERRANRLARVHRRRQPCDFVAEGGEQLGEQPIQLVTETAAPPDDDLVEQCPLGQRDALTEVNTQALERDRPEV